MRGAWIEIDQLIFSMASFAGRSPCGERGLKFSYDLPGCEYRTSLPVRGAWIEILLCVTNYAEDVVAPRAGSVD